MENLNCRKRGIGLDILVYAAYCAVYPLDMAMNFSGSGTVSRMLGMAASALAVLYVAQARELNINAGALVLFWLYPMYSLMSVLWSAGSNAGLTTLLSLMALFSLLAVRNLTPREKLLIRIVMIMSAVAISIWLGFEQENFNNRSVISTSGGTTDPNGLACNLSFSLLIALDFWQTSKKHAVRLFSIAAMLTIIFGIFVTGSRGGAISAAVGIMLYLLWSLKRSTAVSGSRREKRWRRPGNAVFRFVCLIIVAVAVVYYLISSGFINQATIDRMFANDVMETGANGRFMLWDKYLKAVMESPFTMLFGYGYGTYEYITAQVIGGVRGGSHNVLIGHFATGGAVGLVLLCAPIAALARRAFKRRDVLACALLLAAIAACMSLDFYHNKGLWNVFLLAYIGMKTLRADDNGGETNARVLRVQPSRY